MKVIHLLLFVMFLQACNNDGDLVNEPIIENNLYFPPIDSEDWDSKTIESLGWSISATNDLFDFLSQNGTRGFILLSEGKIVMEKYWGNNVQNTAPFERDANWYWASAGKTLTAFLVGLTQEKGIIDIEMSSSNYLGGNWSSLAPAKEAQILVRHHLTMTTGLDYDVPNPDCTLPSCLQYKAEPGSQWYYHNAPYTLLEKVVSNASGQSYNEFTNLNIEAAIGMDGSWISAGDNNVYWSSPRDAARFGLLMLNRGVWSGTKIMSDQNYFEAMVTSSQTLNPSYGFCTWLNGKASIIAPGLPNSFAVPLSPNAPSDLYAAMGKNGQFIDVVPSKKLVVVRMGEAPENSIVPITFHDQMWEKISLVIND